MSAKRVFQLCIIFMLLLTSVAATQPAHAWSSCGSRYVVQPGDWLTKIARNCGVSLADLMAANSWLYYYYYIYPGQVLIIPDGSPGGGPGPLPGGVCGPGWDAYGGYWVVCRGDTLGRIARYYGVSWVYLQRVNNIANANLIYPGQIIRP
jgi:LysM repeat protein